MIGLFLASAVVLLSSITKMTRIRDTMTQAITASPIKRLKEHPYCTYSLGGPPRGGGNFVCQGVSQSIEFIYSSGAQDLKPFWVLDLFSSGLGNI